MTILVTGGAGFIGSHTCVELLTSGYDVIVVDNFSNSNIESLQRVMKITRKKLKLYPIDLLDKEALLEVFHKEKIDAVIHFAGLKAVGESVSKPIEYYKNNITGTLVLCEIMKSSGVKKLIFSSSATVYGNPASVPIRENFPLSATNPYGRSKLMIEEILKDLHNSDLEWDITLLRYFNPIGAHESGLIGEAPRGIPNNLFPYITQVAIGKLEYLNIYGNDYNTPDGTGIRDYIHIMDLARGHVKALEHLSDSHSLGIYNLGTGRGYSVLELVKTFESECGKSIPYVIKPRRPGDIAECYSDPSLAERELNWYPTKGLNDMCRDSWKWQTLNPNGYN